MRYEFSFKDGSPFAIVEGGQMDKALLRVRPKTSPNEPDPEKVKAIAKKLRGVANEKQIKQIVADIEREEGQGGEVSLPSGVLYPWLDKESDRGTWYIAGANGSGKSYYTGRILKAFRKCYPKGQIILFSQKESDPALDKFKPLRIKLDEKLATYPFELSEFQPNSMVVFDDVDSINSRKVQNAVNDLVDLILKVGRSARVNCIITQHIQSNGRSTRNMINECANIVLFPQVGSVHHLEYFMKNYIGLTKEQMGDVYKTESRYVSFHKNVPMYYFYDKGARMFSRGGLSKTRV